MKKHLLYTAFCTVCFGIASAQADFYAGIGAGASLNNGSVTHQDIVSDYKNTPIYSIAGGYELPLPILDIRGEVEYLRIRPNAKYGEDSKFDGVFLNGCADIPFVPVIDPYVGAGIGYTRFDHKNSTAWQGIAGVEYGIPVLPVTLAGEYRYMKVTEAGGKWDSKSKFNTNIFMIKARYSF